MHATRDSYSFSPVEAQLRVVASSHYLRGYDPIPQGQNADNMASLNTQQLIEQWRLYTVGGSTPLPVFITETNGSFLWVWNDSFSAVKALS